ncbi:YwiC-like family protein [Agilicoccus flavus]|uniref:YwiC-like family protein n=1 Tax=Agilicoccus flavus TaxID=2775968 RepID=UPI001CF6439D|nr:YwiC-like family protein [Agilicoccus flavus]
MTASGPVGGTPSAGRPPRAVPDPGRASAYRRAVRSGWWSREHGAWAVLLLPFAAGVLRAGPEPIHAPLLACWLLGYLALTATTTWLTERGRLARRPAGSRRPAPTPGQATGERPRTAPRGRAAALTYGSLAGLLALALVAARPDLLPWGALYVPGVLAAVWFARTGRARSLPADVVVMTAAAAFALVTYQVGHPAGGTILVGRRTMVVIAALVLAYLVGSALFVKTVIRERTSTAYRRASIGYHLAATVVLALTATQALWPRPTGVTLRGTVAATVLFAALTARAAILAGRRVPPAIAGAGEALACLALLFVVAIWS